MEYSVTLASDSVVDKTVVRFSHQGNAMDSNDQFVTKELDMKFRSDAFNLRSHSHTQRQAVRPVRPLEHHGIHHFDRRDVFVFAAAGLRSGERRAMPLHRIRCVE